MTEAEIKKNAGYVQVEGFAHAGAGYFCGTCSKLQYLGGTDGYCKGLKVSVETYGCCNYWAQAPDHQMRGANGVRLVLVVDG
jgi:hypothetical protein